MARLRSGFTLIELLTVIGIIGLLLAILIPAVQSVRESARKTQCQNNLRQITHALQNHESARGALPSLYHGTFLAQPGSAIDEFHFHSWRTAILPQIEQSSLYGQLALDLPASAPRNQPQINIKLPVFLCPSTANPTKTLPDVMEYNGGNIPTKVIGTAARSDYEAIAGVSSPTPPRLGVGDFRGVHFGVWGEPTYTETGKSIRYRTARFRDITDGLSNTMIVGERAGRPDSYRSGKLFDAYPQPPGEGMDHHQAAWGISTHIWWLIFPKAQAINENNATGLYSFHSTGANIALADGAVRFLSESTNADIVSALATRSHGDVVTLD